MGVTMSKVKIVECTILR